VGGDIITTCQRKTDYVPYMDFRAGWPPGRSDRKSIRKGDLSHSAIENLAVAEFLLIRYNCCY